MQHQEFINPKEEFPGIFTYDDFNPKLCSPNSPYEIDFSQSKETLMDVDLYRKFLYSAISRFRSSAFYKHYKAHLIFDLGLDRCQLHPHITVTGEKEVASLEMHHHVLTIFDIAYIICEHTLNTYGTLTSFDLAELIRMEHEAHRVNVVMLCKTCHDIYHDRLDNFKVPSYLGFGKWWELLDRYKYGISKPIADKIYYMLKNDLYDQNGNEEKIMKLLELRDNIVQWSELNNHYFGT